ncbi:MAG: DUF5685 family protein [Hominisplanchenecus sp.]
MFGYIIVNKPEMKFKEYDIYHAYYCGLCRSLKKKYGMTGQMSLSYDMTFLAILLTGLYEPKETYHLCRCAAHPLSKHPAVENVFTEYAADMNVMLTYYKCEDDWKDEKKLIRHAYGILLHSKCKKCSPYPEKAEKIANLLDLLSQKEKAGVEDIDQMAGIFGKVMAEIFAYREDEWEQTLRKMGFYLGKFIYLLDAYEDVEEDIKKDTYNPLKGMFDKENFESFANHLLTMMIAECSKCFEQLPILKNVEILRNILYSGVWYRYEMVREKRKQRQKQEIEINE